MNLKIYSAATTEGVTVAEVNQHLRLDAGVPVVVSTVQVVTSGYHAVTASMTSSGTLVTGYSAIMQVESIVNSAGSTVTVSLQDSNDNATYTDWTAFTPVTTANDTSVQHLDYTGAKAYIRPSVVVTGSDASFGIIVKLTPLSEEESYIGSLITRARGYAERYQRRSLASTTYDYFIDDFPRGDYIKLPMSSPMASTTAVLSVTYMDSLGTTATLTASSSGYYVDIDSEPALISLYYGIVWPSFTPWPSNAIRIRYQAGYTVLPEQTKHAIIMLAGAYYTYRDVEIPTGLLDTIHNLLEDDRIGGWCD